jgi:hypothetical protein
MQSTLTTFRSVYVKSVIAAAKIGVHIACVLKVQKILCETINERMSTLNQLVMYRPRMFDRQRTDRATTLISKING